MSGLQYDQFISQQIPHNSTAPGTSRLCQKTKERQDCCHGVNSDTRRLGMVAFQSFVGTSSNRAISTEPGRHNQWRTEVRGLTIFDTKLFVYHPFECGFEVYDLANIVTDEVYSSERVRLMLFLWSLRIMVYCNSSIGAPRFVAYLFP